MNKDNKTTLKETGQFFRDINNSTLINTFNTLGFNLFFNSKWTYIGLNIKI